MYKQSDNRTVTCFIRAIFTTLAFFSKATVIPVEDAEQILSLRYWNVINMSNITYNLGYLDSVSIVRFQLNYENAYGILPFLFCMLFAVAYKNWGGHSETRRIRLFSGFLSTIFTSFTLIGRSFLAENSLAPILGDGFQIFVSCVNGIGFITVFYFLFINIFHYIDRHTKSVHASVENTRSFDLNSVLKIAGVFLLCWLPYVLVFYPGTMNVDSLFELNQFFGKNYHTHYPLFYTWISGMIFNAGRTLIDDNFGMFLCNICQMVLCALAIAISIELVCSKQKWRKKLTLFFGIFPIFPIWFYTFVKDSIYSAFVMLLVAILIAFVQSNLVIDKKIILLYAVDSSFVILLRNNGWALILFDLILLFFINIRAKKQLVCCTILSLIIGLSVNAGLICGLNANDAFNSDVLSLPLQQTARYASEYELTAQERESISSFISIDDLKYYEPEIADPVKQYTKSTADTDVIMEYLRTYIDMFFKHPMPYFEAFFNLNYGYVFPDRTEYKDGVATYHVNVWSDSNENKFNLHPLKWTEHARVLLESLAYAVRDIPIIGILYSSGIYTWILLILLGIMLYLKHYKKLIVFGPAVATLLICMISPVNAYIRYTLPVMLSMPFYLVMLIDLCNIENPV